MSDFSPFELTPTKEALTPLLINFPETTNLKKGNHISMIYLVFILLILLYSYVIYLYLHEQKQYNKSVQTSDNCIGILDNKTWD